MRISPLVRISRSGSGWPPGVEEVGEARLGELVGREARRDGRARGVDDLGAAAVVQRDVELQPGVLGGARSASASSTWISGPVRPSGRSR